MNLSVGRRWGFLKRLVSSEEWREPPSEKKVRFPQGAEGAS
jgi:hypothetical protein